MENTTEQEKSQEVVPANQDTNRNPDGTFKPGVSGNPTGRPKGKTIREKIREYLEKHPDQLDSIVEYFVKENKELLWQMLEGRPPQKMDVGVDRENIEQLTAFFKAMGEKNDDGG